MLRDEILWSADRKTAYEVENANVQFSMEIIRVLKSLSKVMIIYSFLN